MRSFQQYIKESRIFQAINEGWEEDLRTFVLHDGAGAHKIAGQYAMLNKRFPFKGGTLYRGLNFSSPQQYLAFRRSIKDGYITSNSISSWSPDYRTAEDFAKNKKAYNPTVDVVRAYDKMQRTAERIMGFVGVVLEISVEQGVGIDVAATGQAAEEEVLLPAGRYKVTTFHVEKRFQNLLKGIDYNAAVVEWINSRKQPSNEVVWILKNKSDQLYDDTIKMMQTLAAKHVKDTFRVVTDYTDHQNGWMKSVSAESLLFPDGRCVVDFIFDSTILNQLENMKRGISLDMSLRPIVIKQLNKELSRLKPTMKLSVSSLHTYSYLRQQLKFSWSDIPATKHYFSDVYKRHDAVYRDTMKTDHTRALSDLPRELADVLKVASA